VYRSRNHDDEAIRQLEVVAEICERRGRAGTRMLAETLRSICSCLIRKGELAEARECCGRLLSLSREELGGPEPQDVRLMRDLGDAYLDADDTANAVPLLEQSLELHREMYGEKSARTAHALQSIVRLYADTNRLDAAIDAATRMLEIHLDGVGELHRNTLGSMRRLAQLINQAGRYAEAADLRAELYVARCQVQGADHPQALEVLANMAGDELLAGDRERGERLAREALEAVLAKEPDPGLFTALNNAAWFVVVYPYLTADLYLMAHEAAQRAVRLGNLKVSLNTLGTAQYRVGEFEKALQTLRRSDELLADTTGRYPGNWAFMAMAHHQLGETEKAANAMSRLRELMQESAHANDHECQLFLRETETLIESPRTDRTPSPP
jgi:tetratricopeptide (TPR) repeat protein